MPQPLSIQRSVSTDVRPQSRQRGMTSTTAGKEKHNSSCSILAPAEVEQWAASQQEQQQQQQQQKHKQALEAAARRRTTNLGSSATSPLRATALAIVERAYNNNNNSSSSKSKTVDTPHRRRSVHKSIDRSRKQKEEEEAQQEQVQEEEDEGEKVLKCGKTVSELQLEYDLLAETLTARQQETVLLCRLLSAIYSKWQQMVKAMPHQLVTHEEVEEEADEKEQGGEEEEGREKDEAKERKRHHSRSKSSHDGRSGRRRSGSDSSSHTKKTKDKSKTKKKKRRTFLPIKSSTNWEALELPMEWISYFQLYYPVQHTDRSKSPHREASFVDIPLLVDVLPSNYWEQLVDSAQRIVCGMDGLLHGGGGSGRYSEAGDTPPPLPLQPAGEDTVSSALSASEQIVREKRQHHHQHRHHHHREKEETEPVPSSATTPSSRAPARATVHAIFEEAPHELLSVSEPSRTPPHQRRPPPPPPPPALSSPSVSPSLEPAAHSAGQRMGGGSGNSNSSHASSGYPVYPCGQGGDATQAFVQHEQQQHERENQIHIEVARLAEERLQALEAQLRHEREARLRHAEEAQRQGKHLLQQLEEVTREREETEAVLRQRQQFQNEKQQQKQQKQEQQEEDDEDNDLPHWRRRSTGEKSGSEKRKSIWTDYADTLLEEERKRMAYMNAHEYARRQASGDVHTTDPVESFLFDADKDVVLRTKLKKRSSSNTTNNNKNTNDYHRYEDASETQSAQREIELNKAIIEQQFSAQQQEQPPPRRSAISITRLSPAREEVDGMEEADVCPQERIPATPPPHWERAQPGVWAAATETGFGVSRATTPPTATATVGAASSLLAYRPTSTRTAAAAPASTAWSATRRRRSPGTVYAPAALDASDPYPVPERHYFYSDARKENNGSSPLSIQRSVSNARQPHTTTAATSSTQQQQEVALNTSANEASPPPRLPNAFRLSTVLTHSPSHANVAAARKMEVERETTEFDTIEQKSYFNAPLARTIIPTTITSSSDPIQGSYMKHYHNNNYNNHNHSHPIKSADGTQLLPSPISPAPDAADVNSANASPHRFFGSDEDRGGRQPQEPNGMLPPDHPEDVTAAKIRKERGEEKKKGEDVEELSDESTEPLSGTRNKTKVYNNNNNNNNKSNSGYVNYWSSSS